MSEWTVVLVIISLVGLGAAVIRPIVALNSTITRLTVVVEALQRDTDALSKSNTESHRRLWQHNEEQDRLLAGVIGQLKMDNG